MSNLTVNQKRIIVVVIIVLGLIGYYIYGMDRGYEQIEESEMLINNVTNEIEESVEETIIVHITGEVQTEGIIELKENSRVADAVELAGGLLETADMSKINLAYMLEDGMKIKIPSIYDENVEEDELISTDGGNIVDDSQSTSSTSGNNNGLVNINKATQTELETLPGIGSSTAIKIINYREEYGEFLTIEDIKNVSGIGNKKYEDLKEYICVD